MLKNIILKSSFLSLGYFLGYVQNNDFTYFINGKNLNSRENEFNIKENFDLWNYYEDNLINTFKLDKNNESKIIFNTKNNAQGHIKINHGGFTGLLSELSMKEFLLIYLKNNNIFIYNQIKNNKIKIEDKNFYIKYIKPISTNKNYDIILKDINISNNNKIDLSVEIKKEGKLYSIANSTFNLN